MAVTSSPIEPPRLEFALEVFVTIGAALTLGETAIGKRRTIPITGGVFEGPRIRGDVVPGGADWQVLRPDGCTLLEAIYTLRADDGSLIHVRNQGLVATLEDGARHARTAPTFDAPRGPHEWLNHSLFVSTLDVANPDRTAVVLRMFQVF
jgi:hypothetical protein